MSVFFEANAFIDTGQINNVLLTGSSISNCIITTSLLDMNMQNITSVKDPINIQDAATKKYVDDLGIIVKAVSLIGNNNTLISNESIGSFVITVTNIVLNGPSAIFHITKNDPTKQSHIVRTVASPGINTNIFLELDWPIGSGIFIRKTGNAYDGSYKIKMI